ncbi:protein FAM151B isoform X1 [Gadus chalcogrammus]|uniref:protein FAM151B isoform X1 n=2 Tax=Gadus chalcogrammus TaxID=1042646 RepID=UPI0024C372A6|nr:protein FAM151B isoform X1 [Gadus chalcogrammus]
MTDPTLDYFINLGQIQEDDASHIQWSHATNSKHKVVAALNGPCHMIEADILMRGNEPKEPIMAHPPMRDSDITLQEWLEEVKKQNNKGIKLDFKSLEAVVPSLALLEKVSGDWGAPMWLNADILPGPQGTTTPLEAQAFLDAVGSGASPVVLSLGWTTGWSAGTDNPGYSWAMVRQMEDACRGLRHPVTFPVRAALLAQSFDQMKWLLQQSDRYNLTVWTGQEDVFAVEDLLPYRRHFGRSKIYYDLPDSERLELCNA